MTTASMKSFGFEGSETFNDLLQQAGSSLQHIEVVSALQDCLEADLLPSEVMLRVIGKQSRLLPPALAKRLAANVFALYDSVGREPDPQAKQELSTRVQQLHDNAISLQERAQRSSQESALQQVQEYIETLSAVSQELEQTPLTRRYLFSVRHTLEHLQVCLERTGSMLAL
jgi:hypothetical protein